MPRFLSKTNTFRSRESMFHVLFRDKLNEIADGVLDWLDIKPLVMARLLESRKDIEGGGASDVSIAKVLGSELIATNVWKYNIRKEEVDNTGDPSQAGPGGIDAFNLIELGIPFQYGVNLGLLPPGVTGNITEIAVDSIVGPVFKQSNGVHVFMAPNPFVFTCPPPI